MKNIWTIARRDFKAYFTSPIAYIVIASFMLIMGWMFFNAVAFFNDQARMYQYGQKQMSITDGIIRPIYGNMNVVFLFLVPFITMRLFAEEKKQHTIELLFTAPVSLLDIIFGKFLSALMLVFVILGITSVYPLTLFFAGSPDWGPILTSYIGTFLMAASGIAVGILFSAMTENQIVAAALTFASMLFLWLVSWGANTAGPVWGDLLNYMSLISHYNNFGQGIINTSDVVYFLSFIGTGIFLTHRVLDSYRWR